MERELCSAVLQRWEVVKSLRKRPQDKRTLVENLDCSRSTVNRAIRELEAMAVVEYVDGKYVVTPLGESIGSRFEEMMGTVELWLQLEPFLQWMPDDEFDLELQHLQDAELVLPEPSDPYAMINRHVKAVEQANDHKCILPLIGLHALTAGHKQVVDNGARAELVVTSEAADTLQSNPDYVELTEDMAATGRFNLYQYDGTIPYFVGLLDETVQIGVDEQGEPRALLETDNAKARSWAAATFNEYKHEAQPVMGSIETPKLEV